MSIQDLLNPAEENDCSEVLSDKELLEMALPAEETEDNLDLIYLAPPYSEI